MSAWQIAGAALAGLAAGVLSGFGIGGGTLLVLYLTFAAGMGQREAQGINLVYFICAALPAAVSHVRSGRVKIKPVAFAAGLGAVIAAVSAFLAVKMDTGLLKRLFGLLLLYVGVKELFFTRRGGDADSQDSSEG